MCPWCSGWERPWSLVTSRASGAMAHGVLGLNPSLRAHRCPPAVAGLGRLSSSAPAAQTVEGHRLRRTHSPRVPLSYSGHYSRARFHSDVTSVSPDSRHGACAQAWARVHVAGSWRRTLGSACSVLSPGDGPGGLPFPPENVLGTKDT